MALWKLHDRATADGSIVPTLFLDRDGVMIRDRDYLGDPDLVELLPGAGRALVQARRAGYRLVGVSNQSGLGRGYFSAAEFRAVMERFDERLADEGAALDGFFYCPHAPGEGCGCRKPLPGLLEEAAEHFTWDGSTSWVIGDKESDVRLGLDHGLGACLVRTGYGAGFEAHVRRAHEGATRFFVAADLAAAVQAILARDATGSDG